MFASSGDGVRIDLMGCPVDALTMEGTLQRVEELVEREAGSAMHVCVNAAKIDQMARDVDLARIIREADIVSADGAAVVYASRFLGKPLPERVAGIDLMSTLMARAEERGWSVFLLGAKQDVVQDVAAEVRRRHPRIELAGFHHGYFSAVEEEEVVNQVRHSGAQVLFVARGTPAQERFLDRWRDRLGVRFMMGVGGSFDVLAGRVRRSPRLAREYGLEWAFRLAQDPRRLWRRAVLGSAAFGEKVVRARLLNYRLPR